jgi:hypothetical protein
MTVWGYEVQQTLEVPICGDCGDFYPRLFMVLDDLWVWEIQGPDLLCLKCAERWLRRAILKSDFQPESQ